MAEPHVITALSRKRAELSGDIERMQRELSDKIAACGDLAGSAYDYWETLPWTTTC